MKINDIKSRLTLSKVAHQTLQEFGLLIPLFMLQGELHVLFEIRSHQLRRQPGEICLPGGKMEFGETSDQTALRETYEELGILEDQITLLGKSEPIFTPFGYVLYPHVGYIKPFDPSKDLKISEDEVKDTFSVPLQWFLDHPPENFPIESRFDFPEDFPYHRIQNGKNYTWKSAVYPVYFYEYHDYTIWGMTAKIIYGFCNILTHEKQRSEE